MVASGKRSRQKIFFLAVLLIAIVVVGFLIPYSHKVLFALVPLVVLYFIISPKSVLWLLFLFNWVLYIPKLGKFLEFYIFSVGSVNIYLYDIFIMGLFVTVGAGFLHASARRRIMGYRVTKWVIVYLIYLMLEAVRAIWGGTPYDKIVRELTGYVFCAFIIHTIMYVDKYDIEKSLKVFYYLWLLVPVFELYMLATGDTWITDTGSVRTGHIFPNVFFLGVIAYKSIVEKLSVKNVLIILYMIAGMAMTQYRSAFVALLFLSMFIAIHYVRDMEVIKLIFYPLLLLLIGILLVTVAYMAKPDYMKGVYDRYTGTYNTGQGTIKARAYMWEIGIKTFKNNPIFGIGIGPAIGSDVDKRFGKEVNWSPHNFVVRILAKLGLVGFILVFTIFGSFIRHLLAWKVGDLHEKKLISFALAYFLTTLVVHSMNTTFAAFRTAFASWLCIGMTLVYLDSLRDLRSNASNGSHSIT